MIKIKKIIKKFLQIIGLYYFVKLLKRELDFLSPKTIICRKKMFKFYSQFIKKNDLCFDVGANNGDLTEIFLKLGAKVLVVEPQGDCLKILRKLYGKNKNIIIIDKGLAEKEGFLELSICEGANSISTMSNKWKIKGRFSEDYKWTKTETVPVVTLDSLIKKYGLPNFCKIDVEGFELSVLKGLTTPVPCLSFEFTKEFLEDVRKIIDYLLSFYGKIKFNYTVKNSLKLFSNNWFNEEELYSQLKRSTDENLWGDIYVKYEN
jgi:FkbM family methyltransferase